MAFNNNDGEFGFVILFIIVLVVFFGTAFH